jgi:hypothetical protein
MTGGLEKALRSDAALARLERHLIIKARNLYALGFEPDTPRPTQMAAVGELIRSASDHRSAVESVQRWMTRQLDKLREREERDGKQSWLVDVRDGAPGESLGGTLMCWLSEQRYLPDNAPEELDRMAALQRFWGRFHGLHRYHVEMKRPMPLEEAWL